MLLVISFVAYCALLFRTRSTCFFAFVNVTYKRVFSHYDCLKDSVRDYGLFLRETKRYKPLFEADTLDQQIDALARSGYATDSRYGEKIRGIIEGKTFKELLG